MSDFGEEIINRLPQNSNLRKKNNPMRKIILNGIGEWLQQKSDEDFLEQFYLQDATGKYLDLHGKDYGIKRKIDETDEDYRNRIIYETLGHLTIDYLIDVYDVKLYTYTDDFAVDDNKLVSDNYYISHNGFIGVASDEVKNILNKKFILGSGVKWV